MNLEFFLSKVKKSETLNFDDDLKEADELEKQEFYTPAFLRRWQVVEVVCRELMIQYRACTEVDKLGKKICKKLNNQSIDVSTNKLELQIWNVIYSEAKKRSETSAKYIDVRVIETIFDFLKLKYDKSVIRYLIASQLNKDETLPRGIDKRKTIREQRNDIIHKNLSLLEHDLEKILPCIIHFFELVYQIKEQKA